MWCFMKKSEFKSRRLVYFIKIYQEEIISTRERIERIELVDVNSQKTQKFSSLFLAMNFIISALQKPMPSKPVPE